MRQRFEVLQSLKSFALVGGLLISTALCSGCSSTGQFAPHQAFKQATLPSGYQNYGGYAQPGFAQQSYAQPGYGQTQYSAAYGQQSPYVAPQFYGQNGYAPQPTVPSPFVTGGQPRGFGGFGNNGFSGQC